jgi:Flp pilus assembly protein TadG
MITMLTSRRRRDDHGAQAVEFALLFTFALGPLLYGMIAFGFILNQQITASQLAREAARSAAICEASGDDPATCAQTRFNNNVPPGFTGELVSIAVNCDSTGAEAIVSVAPVLPIPGLATIDGKSTTPCGG